MVSFKFLLGPLKERPHVLRAVKPAGVVSEN